MPFEPHDLVSAIQVLSLGSSRLPQRRSRPAHSIPGYLKGFGAGLCRSHPLPAVRGEQLQGAGGSLVGAGGSRSALQVLLERVGVVQQPEDLRLSYTGGAKEGLAVESEPARPVGCAVVRDLISVVAAGQIGINGAAVALAGEVLA